MAKFMGLAFVSHSFHDEVLRSLGTRAQGSTTMKKFLALYIGTAAARSSADWDNLDASQREDIQAKGMKAWIDWGTANAAAIVDSGGPLGKTKRASKQGIADFRDALTGYVIVQAESHMAAAKLFENHPHFAIFPGDSVEIIECLPLPRP
jgi:hypothetical protein